MERLTYDFFHNGVHCNQVKGAETMTCGEVCEKRESCNGCPIADAFDRLAGIEDILGDTYDLGRLRELVQADRDGRCVVLPVKPGSVVRCVNGEPEKQEIVDCITIYAGGRMTYGFHEFGVKETYVDQWSEDEAENYVPVESAEQALKEVEKDG